jgi:hypothetical protein
MRAWLIIVCFSLFPFSLVPLAAQSSGTAPAAMAAQATVAPVRWLVPAYGNPDACCGGGQVMWETLIDFGQRSPEQLVVIFNPSNGPGTTVDPNYVGANSTNPLGRLRDTGVKVIGYVATDGARRSRALVEAEIQRYYSSAYWGTSPVRLDGIFIDEVSADLDDVAYYRSLRTVIHAQDPLALVIGNPGVATLGAGTAGFDAYDYARLFDVIVAFEGDDTAFAQPATRPAWADEPGAAELASIVHGARDGTRVRNAIDLALRRGYRWLYVTDDMMLTPQSNPYDFLSGVWDYQTALVEQTAFNVSGNWYEPARGGQGLQLEMIDATRVNAFWFTFDSAGNAAWINGQGTLQNNRIEMTAIRRVGGRFPPAGGEAALQAWGTMTFTFTSCEQSLLTWTSTDAAFTRTGTVALTRGTDTFGSSCH